MPLQSSESRKVPVESDNALIQAGTQGVGSNWHDGTDSDSAQGTNQRKQGWRAPAVWSSAAPGRGEKCEQFAAIQR